MVDDLENCDVQVIKAVKKSTNPLAYAPFYTESLVNSLNRDIDILQAEYIPHSSIIPSLLKNKRPLVLKFHGDDALIYPFKNRFNRALINYSLNKADHVITCSEALKNTIISLGYERDKVTAIANGVDIDKFRPMDKNYCREQFNISEEACVCLYAGRLHPMKGIFELIESAKLNPDITFIFGGPGQIPKHMSNCIFLGDISPEKMPVLMNAADFLVLPSHSEGLGLVLLESLACEVPVIASNIGGCPEIVKDGLSGILISPKDIVGLSEAIKFLKLNPDQRRKMGIIGRKDVIDNYDANKLTEKLISVHLQFTD
ncbi:glycosyltransferase family 4 protein [Methanoplanus endosymbiosus]|uniref:Glycosyltransferase family 4 protein n=1 Tax=Methanoplanus endosymbiosus TaxID=33865 RepID=A0A9E7PKQ7_9EURY|nr:glycosyltransferase family 4 protein [Methanoplanus endosymbiosus]UUX91690.1 glycosyltransferase family 4 protein [Methanoplanus endosymbiosus]